MQVLLHPVPGKYFNRLDKPTRGRIKAALEVLKKEPPEGDIEPITGKPGHFRLRIGDYRVLYKIRADGIFVTHIEPRGQAYTKKTKQQDRG